MYRREVRKIRLHSWAMALGLAIACVFALSSAASAQAAISTPTVKLTSPAAAAPGVDYRVFFTATSGLGASNAFVTITAPTGTSFANSTNAIVINLSTNTRIAQCCVTLTNSNATIKIPVGAAAAGSKLEVWLQNVTNPAAGTGRQLSVVTSSDTTPVSSAGYSIVAPQAVSAPAVQLTTPAAGATGVDYRLSFTTSSTGGLTGSGGFITVAAPAGTSFANTTVSVIDTQSGRNVAVCCTILSNANATIKIPTAGSAAGEQLTVQLHNVANPAAPASGLQISVTTSTDSVAALSGAYSVTAARGVSAAAVRLTSAAAGATGVDYRLTFTTSSTGGLAGTGGFMTVAAPSGTSFANSSVSVINTTNGQNVAVCCATLSNANATIKIPVAGPAAGDQLTVLIKTVANPSTAASNLHMTVSTSADTTPVSSAAYSIVAAHHVSAPSVRITTAAAGATAVDYRLTFTTSTTGSLNGTGGFIIVAAPSGTVFTGAQVAVLEAASGQNLASCCVTVTNSGATIKIPVSGAPAADQLTVWLKGVTNPGTAASGLHMSVSTSSDPIPVSSAAYNIVAAHGVSTPAVKLSNTAASATGVTYTVTFNASSTGALSGTGSSITIAAPAGTVFAGSSSVTVFDQSADDPNIAVCCATVTNSGATIKIPVSTAAAQDTLQVILTNTTNPATPGPGARRLAVTTSADPLSVQSGLY